MLPRMPWAEGIVDADVRPMTPFRTSRLSASREKPVANAKMVKRKRLVSQIPLRPNTSATLPKKSKNEPQVKLSVYQSFGQSLRNKTRRTDEEEAVIHVNCEVVMFGSFLMNDDTTRVLPWRKLGIATLIVAVKMNRISCAVERKIAGRALGIEGSSPWALVTSLGWSCFSASSDAATATGLSTEAIVVARRHVS